MAWLKFIVLISAWLLHIVQGSQPENHALNQPTWTTINSTTFQPSYLAVDGNAGSTAYITTDDVWPFLAVDLGARFNLNGISVAFYVAQPPADIHISLSDTPYTSLDASVAAQLSTCSTLPAFHTFDTEFERQCPSGTSGRYAYVYKQGVPGTNTLHIHEIEVYGNPIEIPIDVRSFSVAVECRDDLARVRGLPVCSEVNLTRLRPPCKLREPKDTGVLSQVASISGSSELPRDSKRLDPIICAALSEKMYYCAEQMSGIRQGAQGVILHHCECRHSSPQTAWNQVLPAPCPVKVEPAKKQSGLAFSTNCPFRNITTGTID